MGEIQIGKEPVVRSKPSLVTIGKRTIISTGRWNNEVMADYVIKEGGTRWIKIGELAGVGCASNTIATKKRVRNKLSSLFKELRARGIFLAIEYDGDNSAASAVKIADLSSDKDRQNVLDKLENMKRRKEVTQEQYEKSIALLHKKCGEVIF